MNQLRVNLPCTILNYIILFRWFTVVYPTKKIVNLPWLWTFLHLDLKKEKIFLRNSIFKSSHSAEIWWSSFDLWTIIWRMKQQALRKWLLISWRSTIERLICLLLINHATNEEWVHKIVKWKTYSETLELAQLIGKHHKKSKVLKKNKKSNGKHFKIAKMWFNSNKLWVSLMLICQQLVLVPMISQLQHNRQLQQPLIRPQLQLTLKKC